MKEIKTPSNAAALIMAIIATVLVGGFFLLVICLGAITAIGANANQEFSNVANAVEQAQVETSKAAPQKAPVTGKFSN